MAYVFLLIKRAKQELPKPGLRAQKCCKTCCHICSASHENLRIYCHGTYVSRSSHDQRRNAQDPPSFPDSDLGHALADRAERRVQSKRTLGFSTDKQFWGPCKDDPRLIFFMLYSPASFPRSPRLKIFFEGWSTTSREGRSDFGTNIQITSFGPSLHGLSNCFPFKKPRYASYSTTQQSSRH